MFISKILTFPAINFAAADLATLLLSTSHQNYKVTQVMIYVANLKKNFTKKTTYKNFMPQNLSFMFHANLFQPIFTIWSQPEIGATYMEIEIKGII